MKKEYCPCCHNHCQKENLGCERGINYFSRDNGSEDKDIKEQVITDLRKCGHFLHHHNSGEDLLKDLSEEELTCFHNHLKKICNQE